VVASRDEADPEHPYAVGERYAEAIPGAELRSEKPGSSPLAWQGGQLSKVIAELAARAFVLALVVCALAGGSAWAAETRLEIVGAEGGPVSVAARDAGVLDGWPSLVWARDGGSILTAGWRFRPDRRIRTHVTRISLPGGRRVIVRSLRGALGGTLSPDGSLVAEVHESGIIVRVLASGRVRARLPQSARGDALFEFPPVVAWSRDSTRIGVWAREKGGATLRIADLNGHVRRVRSPRIADLSAAAFSPAGDRIAYMTLTNVEPPRLAVVIVDVATGATRVLPSFDGSDQPLSVAWSPVDARLALGTRGAVRLGDASGAWGPPLPTPDADPIDPFTLAWSPAGDWIAFAIRKQPREGRLRQSIAVLTTASGAARVIVPERAREVVRLAWSPDGRRLAFSGYR
jgi:dipeptidyl aminopeptidase/acylaminoacyl peptidase